MGASCPQILSLRTILVSTDPSPVLGEALKSSHLLKELEPRDAGRQRRHRPLPYCLCWRHANRRCCACSLWGLPLENQGSVVKVVHGMPYASKALQKEVSKENTSGDLGVFQSSE